MCLILFSATATAAAPATAAKPTATEPAAPINCSLAVSLAEAEIVIAPVPAVAADEEVLIVAPVV